MVRTLTKEDVNVTDAESLFDAGALDTTTKYGQPVPPAVREPIFKLAWASFPDRATLGTMVAAQSLDPGVEPVQKSTMQYAEKGETLLVVLGGCMSNDPPAINVLQMPVYTPPPVIKTAVAGPSEGLSIPGRKAYRESLSVTGITQYPTATPAEDFVLLPRTSPYFNLSFDPISIVIFLTPEDRLPPVKGPHGRRTVDAWSFPPPRSDLPPDAKTFTRSPMKPCKVTLWRQSRRCQMLSVQACRHLIRPALGACRGHHLQPLRVYHL